MQRHLLEEIAASFGQGSPLDDDRAETQALDQEARLEQASGNRILREYILEKGLQPDNTPWETFKAISGQSVANWTLGQAGLRAPDTHGVALDAAGVAYENWVKGFESTILEPWLNQWTGERLMGTLAHHEAGPTALGRGGLRMDKHMDAALGLADMATTSLDVAMFTWEQPTILAGVANRAQDLGSRLRVRTNQPISLAGRMAGRVMDYLHNTYQVGFGQSLPTDPRDPRMKVTDHFKFIGANLFDAAGNVNANYQNAAFMIGSANMTQGALGKGTDRFGNRFGDHGGNMESSFVVNYNLVQRNLMSENTFRSLTEQAAHAMSWAHNGHTTGNLGDFSRGRGGAQILTGLGLRQQHQALLASLGPGGKAILTTFNVGQKFLTGTGEAIGHGRVDEGLYGALKRGAQITIYQGARPDFSSGSFAMNAETAAMAELNAFQARLQAEGITGLKVVQNTGQLVHAKVSMFEVNGQKHAIYGSMNLDDQQYDGYYNKRLYEGEVRNLGIYLSDAHYRGLGAEWDLMTAVAESGSLYRMRAAGTRAMVAHGPRALMGSYGLRASALTSRADGSGGFHSHAVSAGGRIMVTDSLGNRAGVDVGNLFTATMTDYKRGFAGQVYIPELSKFVGPARAITAGNTWEDLATSTIPKGSSEVGAAEVIVAGVKAIQVDVEEALQSFARTHGVAELQRRLTDPTFRGRLRQHAKQIARSRFANFAGFEQGDPAYAAKQFARLGLARDSKTGLIDMSGNLVIDPKSLENSFLKSGEKYAGAKFDMRGWDFFFSAGGLSKFNVHGDAKAARFYDMQLFNTLPVAAGLKRRRRDGGPLSDDTEYMFMLPMEKLEQLPQRLQNIMSARNLNPYDKASGVGNGDAALFGKSLFVGVDERGRNREGMKGIHFKGLMVGGMTGDNAYLVGDAFEGAYFGDESWRADVKLSQRYLNEASAGVLLRQRLRQLVDVGHTTASGDVLRAKELGDGRIFLDHKILAALNHQLPLAHFGINGTDRYSQQDIYLKTDRASGAGLILDMSEDGMSLVRGAGVSTLRLHGTLVRELTSGDRSVLGGKFPFAFVRGDSAMIRALQGATDEAHRVMGISGIGKINAVFGAGTIKTGDAIIQTGLEGLKSGDVIEQFKYLRDRQGLDKTIKNFGVLFDKMADFIPDGEWQNNAELRYLIDDIKKGRTGASMEARVLSQLRKTAAHVKAGRTVSMANNPHHVAGAFLGFGIHAMSFMDAAGRDANKLNEVRRTFERAGVSTHGLNTMNLEQMTVQQIFNFVPLSFIGAASASAVAMSSRDRVNFLDYHSGRYTDAFYDMMAMDERVIKRQNAYSELLVGGLLGHGGRDEVVLGGAEFNPMTRFMPGFNKLNVNGKAVDGFAEVLKITRELQGHGKQPLTSERIANLMGKYNAINAAMESAMGHGNGPAFVSRGSTESTTIQMFLDAQLKAKVGARTVLIPRLGRMIGGEFQVDVHGGNMVDHMHVKFNSAESLKSLGSFEDYSHEIQKLQVAIEQKLHLLRHIVDETGPDGKSRVSNRMNALQREEYQNLLETVGALQVAQRAAAATGFQKVLGGQLALGGRNMIAGTLPEIEHGTMVVGSDVWDFMKSGVISDAVSGLQAGGMGVDTFFGNLEKAVHTFERKAYGNQTGRFQHLLDGVWSTTVDPTNKTAMRQAQLNAANAVFEGLLADQAVRGHMMRGLFQRAGAPMGPVGMGVLKVLTDVEYNLGGKSLEIMESLSKRSVFLAVGTMAMNLGDFDGDTASISWLTRYARLNTIAAYGGKLSAVEAGALGRVKQKLNMSWEEAGIQFAKAATGMDTMFSEKRLYVGAQNPYADLYGQGKLTITGARDRLHALEKLDGQRAASGGASILGLTLKGGHVVNADDVAALDAFRGRKSQMYAQSVAANRYVDEMYAGHNKIANYIMDERNLGRDTAELYREFFDSKAGDAGLKDFNKAIKGLTDLSGGGDTPLTSNELLYYFVSTSYASTQMISKVFEISYSVQSHINAKLGRARLELKDKVGALLPESVRKNAGWDGLNPNQALSVVEGYLAARRRTDAYGNRVYVGERATKVANVLAGYNSQLAQHESLSGFLLIAQQIAREAIKPKKGGSIDTVRGILGTRQQVIASAVDQAFTSDRAKGINRLYQMVEGVDMKTGATVDARNWRWDTAADPYTGRGWDHAKDTSWDTVYSEIHRAWMDFHGGQIDSIYATGATDAERMAMLAEANDVGYATFKSAAEAAAVAKSGRGDPEVQRVMREMIAAEVANGDRPVGYAPEGKDLGIYYQKAALRAHMEAETTRQVNAAVYEHMEARETREARNTYMNALNSSADNAFGMASSGLTGAQKLQIIAANAARGKFANEQNLKTALLDTFEHFEDADSLRRTAHGVTTAGSFGDQMAAVYQSYRATGDMGAAIQRAAAGTEAGRAAREEARKKAEADAANNAKLHADLQAKHAAERAAEEDSARALKHIEETFAGGRQSGWLPDTGKRSLAASVDSAIDRGLDAMSRPGKFGVGMGAFFANVGLPTVLAKFMMPGGSGLAGAQAASGALSETAQTFAEMGAMSLMYANPTSMIRDIKRQTNTSSEAATRMGMLAVTFGASVALGNAAMEGAGSFMGKRAGSARWAGLTALAASAGTGFVAGMALSAGLEHFAIKANLINDRNAVVKLVSEVHDASDAVAVGADELEGETNQQASVVSEEIIFTDEEGNPLKRMENMYWRTWAAITDADGQGFDQASVVDGGLDTAVQQSSYDAQGNSEEGIISQQG